MPLLSCQVFTLHLPPTIVVSYRGIEDSICHHTTLWTGSSLGNYRLGTETSLLHFVSVIFGGDFSIEFRTLAAECRWNSEAQWDMFFHGLADYVKDEIYALELPTSLDGLVSLAIRVDARLQQRGQQARRASAVNRLDHLPIPYRDADVGFSEPEPMQMGRYRLSLEEKRRRRNEGLCLYCGAAGHIAAQCPVKARTRQ